MNDMLVFLSADGCVYDVDVLPLMNGHSRSISAATERYVRNIAEDIRDLQSSLQNLDDRNQQDHQEMKNRQANVEQKNQNEEERKILNWLSSHNYASKQNDLLSRRHGQTGGWFLNCPEFQNWVTNPGKMLFCPGIPGAGKSVLASISLETVKTRFENAGSAVVCVFCNLADAEHQQKIDLIASLLEQLTRTTGVTDELRILHQRHQAHREPLRLQDLSVLLRPTTQKFARVFIVVDALDECPKTTRIPFLVEIHNLRSSVSLLITSRLDKYIQREFHDAIHLEIQARDADLESYIRSKTQQDSRLALYTAQDSSLQDGIIKTITGNASGMFLLAQLQVESLADQMSKREMLKALNSLPKELDATYDRTMERIQSQKPNHTRLANRVLAWISSAHRPLHVLELQHALAVDVGDSHLREDAIISEDDLVFVCAGLVTIDQKSQIIRLVHHTAQDYFEHLRSQIFPTINVKIATVCITYLEFDGLMLNDFTPQVPLTLIKFDLSARFPFLDYAVRYWGHHVRGTTETLLRKPIHHLLKDRSKRDLACYFLDYNPFGWRDFNWMPALRVLAHFGLDRIINASKFDDISLVSCVIRYRDDRPVFFLVERDDDSFIDEHLLTMNSYFVLEGRETMVRLLHTKGVKIDLGVDNGEFLFTWSLRNYDGAEGGELMSTLIALGARFDPNNITYYTPLMCAIIGGDKDRVWKLVKGGVDVNEKNGLSRDALFYAALAREEGAVRPLLRKGANVHSRDENGRTPLIAACEGGSLFIVKLLLAKGADISAQDEREQTPISIATRSGHESLSAFLRDHRACTEAPAGGALMSEGSYDDFWGSYEYNPEPARVFDCSEDEFIETVRRETLRRGYDNYSSLGRR